MTHVGEDEKTFLPIRVVGEYNCGAHQKSEDIAPVFNRVERCLLYSPLIDGFEAPRLLPLTKSSELKRHGIVKNDRGAKAILCNAQNHNACSRTLLAVYDRFHFV